MIFYMKIQSELNSLEKIKKLNVLKKIIVILLILIFLTISLMWRYAVRYSFGVNSIVIQRCIFLDDYVLFYEIIERPRNIREDILFHSIGEEYIYDLKSGEDYDYPISLSANVYKIKSRNDFQYIIFEENNKIQLGKFRSLYPISFSDMTDNEKEEKLRGIYKTIFKVIYNVYSFEDIKSVHFAKIKKNESEIKSKKYTDKDTLKNIFDIICELELKFIKSSEELWILQQPQCNITITFKNNREITFYYNSTYKLLYEYQDKFDEISDETNNYIISLISMEEK